jgi:hypothetical protein
MGGVNLYGFVGNDGVNRWDFLGLAETNGMLMNVDKWQAWLDHDIENGNVLKAIGDFCGCVANGFAGSYCQAAKEMNPMDKDAAIREYPPQSHLRGQSSHGNIYQLTHY